MGISLGGPPPKATPLHSSPAGLLAVTYGEQRKSNPHGVDAQSSPSEWGNWSVGTCNKSPAALVGLEISSPQVPDPNPPGSLPLSHTSGRGLFSTAHTPFPGLREH